MAGVVEEVGTGVTSVQPGDHVIVSLINSCGCCFYCEEKMPALCETQPSQEKSSRLQDKQGSAVFQGMGTSGFAEYTVVDQSQVVTIPKHIPFESAALLSCCVITGLGAVTKTARVQPGSSAVIVGVGGVGLNSIQGARISGAQPIIAVDLFENKLEVAKSFGATDTINPANMDVQDEVRALTKGRGADYVFLSVGSVAAFEQSIKLLRPGGTLVVIGMPGIDEKAGIEVFGLVEKSIRIVGSFMGSAVLQTDVPKLIELYEQGELMLDELVTARYQLEDINEAIAAVEQGDVLRNVIVFESTGMSGRL